MFEAVVVHTGEVPRANVKAEIDAAQPAVQQRLGSSVSAAQPKMLWTQAAADKAVAQTSVKFVPTAIVKGRVNAARTTDANFAQSNLSAFARGEEGHQRAGAGRAHELGLPLAIRC